MAPERVRSRPTRSFSTSERTPPFPAFPAWQKPLPLTHIEALELDYLPSHLIVIGGGYAGLELSQAYRRFGSKVTIIESGPQLIGREDIDVSQEMRQILTDEGIQVHVAAELLDVQGRSGDKVSLLMRTASGEQKIEGSDILVAAGRVPNTAGIGLEQTGVKVDGRGYIRVNERLETTAAEIWAIGECAGSPQFTHVSEDDFRIIRDNLIGGNRSTRDRLIPYCMFTDPPLAHVGLSEGDAERQGVIVRVARLPVDSVLRAQATGERQGLMKVLVGENDDRILGFTMIGAAAGEVMAVVQMAMLAGAPYGRLARRHSRAPNDGRGTGHAVFERAAPVTSARHAGKSGVDPCFLRDNCHLGCHAAANCFALHSTGRARASVEDERGGRNAAGVTLLLALAKLIQPWKEASCREIAYRTTSVEGMKVFYREAGPMDAPTLLLLHGFPTSSHMFRDLIPLLADRFHIVAPDLPGFGLSVMPEA